MRGFEGRCLRGVLGIAWEDRVGIERVGEVAEMGDIGLDIGEGRWRWTGHVLRVRSGGGPCGICAGPRRGWGWGQGSNGENGEADI